MTSLSVKNLPEAVYERLKDRAKANRRSLNREIIACLEQAVTAQRVDPEALLAVARQFRDKTSRYQVTEADLDQMKDMGRP